MYITFKQKQRGRKIKASKYMRSFWFYNNFKRKNGPVMEYDGNGTLITKEK
jgi:hypothetical protein